MPVLGDALTYTIGSRQVVKLVSNPNLREDALGQLIVGKFLSFFYKPFLNFWGKKQKQRNKRTNNIESVKYQCKHNPGFLGAFLSCLRNFPLYGMHEEYKKLEGLPFDVKAVWVLFFSYLS